MSKNRESARVDVANAIAALIAAHTSYPLVVEIDNREVVDQAQQTVPYLKVQIKWLGGDQKDLADKPFVGQYGQILLAACVKLGSGSKAANDLLDFAVPFFELKSWPTIITRVFEPMKDLEEKGWYHVTGLVNMYYYRVSV